MAYTKRGYLYQSEREGKKVKTRYLGRGETAELIALIDEGRAAEREEERKAKRAERRRVEAADAQLTQLGRLVKLLTEATLLINGYHPHKRQWRKRHNDRKRDNCDHTFKPEEC